MALQDRIENPAVDKPYTMCPYDVAAASLTPVTTTDVQAVGKAVANATSTVLFVATVSLRPLFMISVGGGNPLNIFACADVITSNVVELAIGTRVEIFQAVVSFINSARCPSSNFAMTVASLSVTVTAPVETLWMW